MSEHNLVDVLTSADRTEAKSRPALGPRIKSYLSSSTNLLGLNSPLEYSPKKGKQKSQLGFPDLEPIYDETSTPGSDNDDRWLVKLRYRLWEYYDVPLGAAYNGHLLRLTDECLRLSQDRTKLMRQLVELQRENDELNNRQDTGPANGRHCKTCTCLLAGFSSSLSRPDRVVSNHRRQHSATISNTSSDYPLYTATVIGRFTNDANLGSGAHRVSETEFLFSPPKTRRATASDELEEMLDREEEILLRRTSTRASNIRAHHQLDDDDHDRRRRIFSFYPGDDNLINSLKNYAPQERPSIYVQAASSDGRTTQLINHFNDDLDKSIEDNKPRREDSSGSAITVIKSPTDSPRPRSISSAMADRRKQRTSLDSKSTVSDSESLIPVKKPEVKLVDKPQGSLAAALAATARLTKSGKKTIRPVSSSS